MQMLTWFFYMGQLEKSNRSFIKKKRKKKRKKKNKTKQNPKRNYIEKYIECLNFPFYSIDDLIKCCCIINFRFLSVKYKRLKKIKNFSWRGKKVLKSKRQLTNIIGRKKVNNRS